MKDKKYKIILASSSPRRKDILETAGYEFKSMPADIDEAAIVGDNREDLMMNLATEKAEECARITGYPKDTVIIGADTLVFADERILGKPKNEKEWRETLRLISGRKHNVITGVCIWLNGQVSAFYGDTEVTVCDLTEEDIDKYIELDEDMDKAGGYAIQGAFAKFIPCICGEYNNVVGFPIAKFNEYYKKLINGEE